MWVIVPCPTRIGGMLTVIGEALVDVVNRSSEPAHAHPGGSPMNVAVGVARLGHEAEFVGRYGADNYGSMIEEHLQDSGVQLPVGADQKKTSVAQAHIGESGAAEYEFEIDWSLDNAKQTLARAAKESAAIHVGSIGAMLEPGASVVVETVRAASGSALISYDPNCRPSIIPDASQARTWAERIVPEAGVVKASDEDLLWLYPHRTVEETAKAWLSMGASLVIVTRGELGMWALNAATAPSGVEIPAVTVQVADTVGAGDSLMAALLAFLLDRGIEGASAAVQLARLTASELEEMLHFAASAAAITVSRAGANPPTRAELEEFLGKV